MSEDKNLNLSNPKDAIWVGRFQPPTIGHLVSLFVILSKYKKCTVGIVHYTRPPADISEKWKPYIESAESVLSNPPNNPFTPQEILNMWNALLAEYNLTDRVEVIPMTRVAYQLDFNKKYPPSEIDFVDIELNQNDPQSDRSRQEAFQKNLNREIIILKSPIKIHASDIREAMKTSNRDWKQFLATSVIKIIGEIDGVNRIKNIIKL